MFKLFKKNAVEKTVETSHLTAPGEAPKKYPKAVVQIHREFSCAGETLLKESLLILEECSNKDCHTNSENEKRR